MALFFLGILAGLLLSALILWLLLRLTRNTPESKELRRRALMQRLRKAIREDRDLPDSAMNELTRLTSEIAN